MPRCPGDPLSPAGFTDLNTPFARAYHHAANVLRLPYPDAVAYATTVACL